jgi:misacylated tRNA(Ala) deacylase
MDRYIYVSSKIIKSGYYDKANNLQLFFIYAVKISYPLSSSKRSPLLLRMNAIYLEDSYLRSFNSFVEQASNNGIYLNATAFYPESGGQPGDLGIISRNAGQFKVIKVELVDGRILHHLDREGLQAGDQVVGSIDWERRYKLMRSHTACHILSAIIFQETGARITGNQIDLARSRVDFSLESFDRAKMADYVQRANDIVAQGRKVEVSFLTREDAARLPNLVKLAMQVPDRERIRVVEIEGLDQQACGGTHVMSTAEVKGLRLVKAENKGKSNRRVYFELEE